MTSFIRWAGSKKQIVNQLASYWGEPTGRYIEPFAGSACLFFELNPPSAVLGDVNSELTCTFRMVQTRADDVIDVLRSLPVGKEAYYSIRAKNIANLSEPEVAARFIYLNRYCFNGLYRTNLQGFFNVPYGPPRSGLGPNEDLIRAASIALRNVTIVTGDFQETTDLARRGDFVYLDPPYIVAKRRVFSEYMPNSFGGGDLERLQQLLVSLEGKGVAFLVSYADCKEARSLLKLWSTRRVRTRRNIAGFAGHRRASYELLASNREPVRPACK